MAVKCARNANIGSDRIKKKVISIVYALTEKRLNDYLVAFLKKVTETNDNENMEAKDFPKKIYLQENTTTDLCGEIWPEWFEASSKDSDVEYIRKDVILDWLKARIATKKTILEQAVVQATIEKIESL